MRIAVCDDESFFRNQLKDVLDEYAKKYSLDFSYYEYADGTELVGSDLTFDLIFMDYQMKDKNGIDTVDVLRKRNIDTKVIFISSFKEIVFDSLRVKTYRFLVKPLDNDKLYEALNSLLEEKENIAYIIAKDEQNDKSCCIEEKDIVYIQADNIYAIIRTKDKFYRFSDTISALEKTLKSNFFYRTNRSYIVNLKHIENYCKTDILFDNGEKALLTKTKFKDFQKVYFDFLRQESIGEKF